MRKSLKYGLLGAAATVALGSFAGSASATPYAFGEETFNSFIITLGGTATLDDGSVTTTDFENYPGAVNGNTVTTPFGNTGNAGPGTTAGNVWGGPNATYSAANPPPVTTFNPSPVGESTLKGGFGAQAASSVGGLNVFSAPGDGAYEVAEAGAAANKAISANASQSENVFFTISTGAGGGSLDVTASVQAYIEALTTQFGETASSQASASLVLSQCAPGSSTTSCSSPVVIDTVTPSVLNLNVNAGPTTADLTAGDPSMFTDITSGLINLSAQTVYQIAFQTSVTVSTSSVPEPASLAIFGTGLIGLGFMFSRRQNKQA